MSRGVKLSIIIAVALIAAGAILGRLGFSLADWGKGVNKMTKQTASYEGSKITDITVDCDALNINAFPVEGSDITLAWYDDENQRCEISDANGELTVKYREFKRWYEYIRFGFRMGKTDEYTLEIGIPDGYKGPLTLSTASGKIEAKALIISGDVKLDSTSGIINMEDIVAGGEVTLSLSSGNLKATNVTSGGDISMKTTSGIITAETMTLKGDINAETSSGRLKINDVTGAEKVTMEVTSGSINLSDISAADFKVTSTSGSISFDNIYAEKTLYFDTTSGSIRGNISDSIKNYSISSSCLSGSNNLPKNITLGEKKLTAKVSSGNINIEFND